MWKLSVIVLFLGVFFLATDARRNRYRRYRLGRLTRNKAPFQFNSSGRIRDHHILVIPSDKSGTRITEELTNICQRVICPTGTRCAQKSTQCINEPCSDYAVCESIIANTEDPCQRPKVAGSCTRQYDSWYFNSESRTCEEFQYSGCDGNENRFGNKKLCVDACVRSDQICRLKSEVGPCRAAIRRWFYDVNTMACKEFIYGGCKGNDNNFDTEVQCLTTCSNVTMVW